MLHPDSVKKEKAPAGWSFCPYTQSEWHCSLQKPIDINLLQISNRFATKHFHEFVRALDGLFL